MQFNQAQDVESCLVRIHSDNNDVVGTGFLIGEGYILTCHHVIQDIFEKQSHIAVSVSVNSNKPYIAKVVSAADDKDVALLQIVGDFFSLPLSDIGDNQPGDRAWISGFQLTRRLGNKPYLADALISSLDTSGMLLLEANLLPGMSGAPIFNLSSRKVVGIVTSRVTKDNAVPVINTGIAIPIEKILGLWPWLREINDKATKRYLLDKFNGFKSQIARILQDDFGATIEIDQAVNGYVIDIIATQRGLGRPIKTAVLCFPDTLSTDIISSFGSVIISLRNDRKVDDGLIVTDQKISEEIHKIIISYPMSCKTSRDLEDDALGLSNYIEKLIDDYENIGTIPQGRVTNIPELCKLNSHQYYVDLDARDQNENKYQPIDTFFAKWLEQDYTNLVSLLTPGELPPGEFSEFDKQVSILGDSGVGKTSFCLHLTYFVAMQWRDKKLTRLPIYIPLKGYSSKKGLDDVINATLKGYGIRADATQILRHTIENGRFLLIFDGFDEMGESIEDDEIQKRFEEISRFANKYGKVVLTCRSNFFQFEADEKHTLSPLDVASQLLIRSENPKAYILYIEPFDETKILEFLGRHPSISGTQAEWWEKIKTISNMSSLSHRPILLRMLVDAIPTIETISGDISAARLYAVFIQNLLQSDKQNRRTLTLEPKERLDFLKVLALDLMESSTKSFQWSDLPRQALQIFKRLIKTKARPDFVEYDLRNIPLLQRRGDKFNFIHDSFVEFLAAWSIVEILIEMQLTTKDYSYFSRILNEEVRKFIVEIVILLQQTNEFQYTQSIHDDQYVLIPDGPFISGGYEKGLEIKVVSKPFLIGKYPVTWQEYEIFKPGYRKEMGLENLDANAPVTYVSWEKANEYCAWLSRTFGKKYRLPSQNEWEKAARGIDGRLYPWGDDLASYHKANYGYRYSNAVQVNSFDKGVSPYGVMDMSGNVSELTSTSEDEGISQICCGGSWEDPASRIQCASQRKVKFKSAMFHDVGFRIVQEIDSEGRYA